VTASRELDALVAEKVMGESLKPHRDVALVAVGRSKISCTGPTFLLCNGREIPMPNGEKLRAPEGDRDWNSRYYLHVAEVLGDEIAAEVDAYHLLPKRYSSDTAAAWRVVEKMRADGVAFVLGSNGCSAQVSVWFVDGIWALGRSQNSVPEQGAPRIRGAATADTAPLAICLAALKAVGVEIN
jgi:hypothetical protein